MNRMLIACLAFAACDSAPLQGSSVEPIRVAPECKVCVGQMDGTGHLVGLEAQACPGDTDGEACSYLGCELACLEEGEACLRPATCGPTR